MRTGSACAFVSLLILDGCAGSAGSLPGGFVTSPPLQQASRVSQVYPTARGFSMQELYVASATPYFFDAYSLPLQNNESPALMETGVNEPVPLADDERHLYVGSFDDGTIYTYDLPLAANAPRERALTTAISQGRYMFPFSGRRSADTAQGQGSGEGIPSGLGDLSGLAVHGDRLYVAGDGTLGEEVLEYKLPLIAGELPSGSITGFSVIDFLGLAAQSSTLYIASTTAGTIGAYHLPLKSGELPQYTISTVPQIDAATGIAAGDCNLKGHLYVTQYSDGDVEDYALPYQLGEMPTTLDVRSSSGGELPYGIAVDKDHLFVTAGSILSYRLPLSLGETPDAVAPFTNGFATGVAVSHPCG